MTVSGNEGERANRLYEKYGRPLEDAHLGEFLAVAPDGRTLLAPSLLEAVERAAETFGPNNHVFKIGVKTVGTWLWLNNR